MRKYFGAANSRNTEALVESGLDGKAYAEQIKKLRLQGIEKVKDEKG